MIEEEEEVQLEVYQQLVQVVVCLSVVENRMLMLVVLE
jgi:hypothetical protein